MTRPTRRSTARTNRTAAAAASLTLAAALATFNGCARDTPTPLDTSAPRAFVKPPAYDRNDRPITSLLPSRRDLPHHAERAQRLDDLTLTGARDRVENAGGTVGAVPTGELMRVELAFAGAPASAVARTLLSRYLDTDYLVDDNLPGQITLETDQQMTAGDVSALLNTLASIYGWSIERTDNLTVVRPRSPDAFRSPRTPIMRTSAAFGGAEPALRVRRMRYLDPASLAGDQQRSILPSIMSEGALIASSGNLLVLGDTTANLNKAAQLLSIIDTPAFDGVRLVTYRLAHQDPADAAELANSLAENTRLTGGSDGATPLVSFIEVPRTDRLLVVSRDPTALRQAELLIDQVDRPDALEQRYRFIYRMQHADTTKVRAMIDSFFKSRIEADGTIDDTDKMQLTWENEDGLLLVRSTYDDYLDLVSTLRQIDGPPQQVLLQTVIAEVALTDDFEFGVEYFLDAISEEGFGNIELTGTPGQAGDPTGSAFFVGGSGLALVTALDREGSVNILQQPRVTLADGVEGKFQVGGEVPVQIANQDTDTSVGGDTTVRREIEFRETGVILTVQPTINEGGYVRLALTLEIRSVGVESELGPTFDLRLLENEVIVPHGKTLVLAGFIDDSRNESSSRIPVLGGIPGVGTAFTNLDKSDLRRELLFTITPEVINNPNRANTTVDRFLETTRRIRSVLTREPEDLPQGILRDPALDPTEPAVNIVLPKRPDDDNPPRRGEPITAPERGSQNTPPDTNDRPRNTEPRDQPEMPSWMERMLDDARRDTSAPIRPEPRSPRSDDADATPAKAPVHRLPRTAPPPAIAIATEERLRGALHAADPFVLPANTPLTADPDRRANNSAHASIAESEAQRIGRYLW